MNEGVINLRNMDTGEEQNVTLEKLITIIKK
jgi:histidyl-tRNA synthetase